MLKISNTITYNCCLLNPVALKGDKRSYGPMRWLVTHSMFIINALTCPKYIILDIYFANKFQQLFIHQLIVKHILDYCAYLAKSLKNITS